MNKNNVFGIVVLLLLIPTISAIVITSINKISKLPQPNSTTMKELESHMKTCPECSKEVVDSGPPPLCEKGFELLKKAVKE